MNKAFNSKKTKKLDWNQLLVEEMNDYTEKEFAKDYYTIKNVDALHKYNEGKKLVFDDMVKEHKKLMENKYRDFAIENDLNKLFNFTSAHINDKLCVIEKVFKSRNEQSDDWFKKINWSAKIDWSVEIEKEIKSYANQFKIHLHILQDQKAKEEFDEKKNDELAKILQAFQSTVPKFEQDYRKYEISNDLPKISDLAKNHMKNEDVQTKIVLRNAEKENFMWSEQIVEEIQSYMKEHINDHPLLNDDVTVGKFNEIANEVKASIEGKHSRAQLIKCTDAIGEATKEQLDDDWKKIDECNSIAQNTAFTDEIQQAISNREEKLRIKNDSKINQDNNRPKIKFKKNIKECCGCISFHIVLVISHFITVILAWVAPEPSHVYIIITLIFSDLFFGILFLTFFCVMCDNTIEDKKILQILLTIVTALIFSFNVIATKDAYEYKSTFKCCHWSMNAFVMSIICCIAYAFIVALQTLEFNCK